MRAVPERTVPPRGSLSQGPAHKKEKSAGEGRDIEAEFDQILQGQAAEAVPDGFLQGWRPSAGPEAPEGEGDEDGVEKGGGEACIGSLLQVVVVGQIRVLDVAFTIRFIRAQVVVVGRIRVLDVAFTIRFIRAQVVVVGRIRVSDIVGAQAGEGVTEGAGSGSDQGMVACGLPGRVPVVDPGHHAGGTALQIVGVAPQESGDSGKQQQREENCPDISGYGQANQPEEDQGQAEEPGGLGLGPVEAGEGDHDQECGHQDPAGRLQEADRSPEQQGAQRSEQQDAPGQGVGVEEGGEDAQLGHPLPQVGGQFPVRSQVIPEFVRYHPFLHLLGGLFQAAEPLFEARMEDQQEAEEHHCPEEAQIRMPCQSEVAQVEEGGDAAEVEEGGLAQGRDLAVGEGRELPAEPEGGQAEDPEGESAWIAPARQGTEDEREEEQ